MIPFRANNKNKMIVSVLMRPCQLTNNRITIFLKIGIAHYVARVSEKQNLKYPLSNQ